MDNLIVSFQVVFPLFVLMALGYFLRCTELLDDHTLNKMNTLVFKLFLPAVLLINLYNTNIEEILKPKLLIFEALGIICCCIITYILVVKFVKNKGRHGAMVQAIFRSNFVLFGLPITQSMFGKENTGVASVLMAIAVPLFNILSVVVLESFRGGKFDFRKILIGIMKNPMIIGSIIGLSLLFLNINLPQIILTPLKDIGTIATPLALIVLGGTFKISAVKQNLTPVIVSVTSRLIIIPSIFVIIAVSMGYRGVELVAIYAVFGSPSAVASFAMAKQMDADYELAGQTIVFTTLFSVITVFLWIFSLREFGLI